jgi:hypothetical protein
MRNMKKNIDLPQLNLDISIVGGSFIHKLSGIHLSLKERTAEKRKKQNGRECLSDMNCDSDADAMQSIIANVKNFL